jgi:hypothetical protein
MFSNPPVSVSAVPNASSSASNWADGKVPAHYCPAFWTSLIEWPQRGPTANTVPIISILIVIFVHASKEALIVKAGRRKKARISRTHEFCQKAASPIFFG